MAGTTLLLSAVMIDALTSTGLAGQPAAAEALFTVGYLIGGAAHVVALAMMIGTTAIAGRLSGRLPGWLSTPGFVATAPGLVAVLNLGAPLLPFALTAYFIPAGRFLGLVFIVATVVTLRRAGHVRDAR